MISFLQTIIDLLTTDNFLLALAIGFVVYSLPELFNRLGYIIQAFKTQDKASALGFTINQVIGCLKCTLFWSVLILTQSFQLAALTALIIYILTINSPRS